jgi:hypothetical protein
VIVQCEHCNEEKECAFVGRPADPAASDDNQQGVWICDDCLEPFNAELDEAIKNLTDVLND